jgi:DNA replication protein DnaC
VTTELDGLLKRLHLANARRLWNEIVRRAEEERWSYETFLRTLVEEEVAHRKGTRLRKAVRRARFPFLKTIEEFDFSFQSSLRLQMMGSFLSPDFVTDGRSLILHGKPGRGKTHLAIAIGYRAIQHGFDVSFVTAAALIDDLSASGRDGLLRDSLAAYLRPHVLIVDEVGYLTYGSDAANVLFHVVNERHIRKRAMVFTTNKDPKTWGAVLHDDDLAEAIVDRILERGRLLRLDGPSARTKHLTPEESSPPGQAQHVRLSGKTASDFPEPTHAVITGHCPSLPMHAVITGEQGAHHCRYMRSSQDSKPPITAHACGHHRRASCPSPNACGHHSVRPTAWPTA